MPLPKLMLMPAQAGYSGTPGSTFKQARLGGGRSRFRLDSANAAATVNVQWACTPIQYQYLMAFVRTALSAGSLDFLCDLIFDDAIPGEYQVHFLDSLPALVGVQGNLMTVRGQVELVPKAVDPVADNALLMLYAAYGEDAGAVLRRLAKLANEDLTVLS